MQKSPLALATFLTLAALAGCLHISNATPNAANSDTGPILPTQVHIHDIQGATRISPFNNKNVSNVPGIVTAVRSYGSAKGFWFQDPNPDNNPATSEGIFVATNAAPSVKPGDAITLDGKVLEFYPHAKGFSDQGNDTSSQSLTEITDPVIHVVSQNNPIPAPIILKASDIPDAYAPMPAHPGDSIEALNLQPKRYALDLYESLEGMNVEVDNARVVGPTDNYHELWITAKPDQNPTPRGGTIYLAYNQPNSGRLQIQSLIPLSKHPFPQASVGDTLTGPTTGPLDYNRFGGYTVMATTLGAYKSGHLQPTVAPAAKPDQLSLATYNVENLTAGNNNKKFARLAQAVIKNLATPDIIALEEIQDNDGTQNDGVVACDQTMTKFIDAIKAAGGPTYDWRGISPVNDQDGGEPGGNIRQVLLFNPQRVTFTDIPGGAATSSVDITTQNGQTRLTASPGRIAPNDPAWKSSRKPLAAQFLFHGKTIFVIANHLEAKLGDQGLDSRYQPPARPSERQRVAQCNVEQTFIAKLLAADPHAQLVVLGDLNDFPFSPAVKALASTDLKDMFDTLPANERYSYVYQGNSQAIDHILVSPAVRHPVYTLIHINAEFAHQTSDHDPQVLRIEP